MFSNTEFINQINKNMKVVTKESIIKNEGVIDFLSYA